jgi:ABC-type amino acid transport substrate-binding protein
MLMLMQAVGSEVDLARALARDLSVEQGSSRGEEGVQVAWVQSSWQSLLDDLLNDRFDLAIGGTTLSQFR